MTFFAILDSTNKYLKQCTAQNCSKNRQICGNRNSICGIRNTLWNPQINKNTYALFVCGFHLHISMYVALQIISFICICGFHLNFADSTFFFAKSTHSCAIQIKWFYLLVAETAANQTCRQNLRHRYQYAESAEFMSGIHLHFGTCLKICLWNPGLYTLNNFSNRNSIILI